VVSPLLANVVLHRLDRAWHGGYGTLVRYADDLVVLCKSQGQTVAALARLRVLLAELGLQPKEAKTRIVQLTDGGEGVDFLGFHHRLVRSRVARGTGQVTYLARWPSRKAMQHARDRIRFMTMRARLAAPVEQVVQEMNPFLRGWAGYFRYGNSAHTFGSAHIGTTHEPTRCTACWSPGGGHTSSTAAATSAGESSFSADEAPRGDRHADDDQSFDHTLTAHSSAADRASGGAVACERKCRPPSGGTVQHGDLRYGELTRPQGRGASAQ
jgi:hypothetical protein